MYVTHYFVARNNFIII